MISFYTKSVCLPLKWQLWTRNIYAKAILKKQTPIWHHGCWKVFNCNMRFYSKISCLSCPMHTVRTRIYKDSCITCNGWTNTVDDSITRTILVGPLFFYIKNVYVLLILKIYWVSYKSSRQLTRNQRTTNSLTLSFNDMTMVVVNMWLYEKICRLVLYHMMVSVSIRFMYT